MVCLWKCVTYALSCSLPARKERHEFFNSCSFFGLIGLKKGGQQSFVALNISFEISLGKPLKV